MVPIVRFSLENPPIQINPGGAKYGNNDSGRNHPGQSPLPVSTLGQLLGLGGFPLRVFGSSSLLPRPFASPGDIGQDIVRKLQPYVSTDDLLPDESSIN